MKVLLISHNAVSTYQSMGKTFLSLFSSLKKDEVCQLYIYPSVPDADVFNSYYRITDKEVLFSFLKRKKAYGGEITVTQLKTAESHLFENTADAYSYRKKGNTKPLKRLMRDFVWAHVDWYTDSLRDWLAREAPEVIFLAPGYAKFIYDVAILISRELKIPIVTYICDDYYFVEQPKSVFGRIQLSALKKKTDELFFNTLHLVSICEEIKDIYQKHFSVDASCIMTGTNYSLSPDIKVKKQPKAVRYFGNIRCGRASQLANVGRALDELNRQCNENFRLEIYTSEQDQEILAEFGGIDAIKLCGFLSGDAFEEKLLSSDVLLHVESFEDSYIDLVKHSVSTKIADSLASGIPLLAVGPSQVSSMLHLIRNEAAVTACSLEEIPDALKTIFFDSESCAKVAENALKTASKYHDSSLNSEKLKEVFKKVTGKD